MLFLHDLPNWLLGVTVIGFTVAAAYGGYFLFHRLTRAQFSDDHRGVAMSVLGIVATVNSLLLAFSAVSVWDAFQDADAAVMEEGDTIGALARDLAVFNTPNAAQARTMLRQYAQTVVDDEWPSMQRGEANLEAWNEFDDLFRAVAALEPGSPRQETWMSEIVTRMNELLKLRRTRLYAAQAEVPGTLWTVVLIGTVLCMLVTYVLPPARFHLAMIGALAVSIGLVFYFIVAMDRPYAGNESISPAPLVSAIDNMQRWDDRSTRR